MTIKIAILAFTNPLRGNLDGGKVDIYNRLKAFENIDCMIDLYLITKESEFEPNYKRNLNSNITIYEDSTKNKLIYLFNELPISVNNKYSSNFANILSTKEYDLCLYEGEHMYKYLKKVNSKINFLRMHDIESCYRKELSKSTSNVITSILQLNDSKKYDHIENKIVSEFDKLLFISKSEKETFDLMYPKYKERFVWMPPAISNFKESINYTGKSIKNILFFGDLKVSHNIEGICWFKENVLPIISKEISDVSVDIIGNVEAKIKSKLNGTNVNVHGYVDDLDEFIEKSTLIICPMLHGAGVKIKLVESLAKGKIVVATGKAIEGTDFKDLQHLLVANTAQEFADCCLKVLFNDTKYMYLAENSLEHIKSNYSIKSQGNLINNLYSSII